MKVGVVEIAVAIWGVVKDIHKLMVPKNLVSRVGVAGVNHLGNGLINAA